MLLYRFNLSLVRLTERFASTSLTLFSYLYSLRDVPINITRI